MIPKGYQQITDLSAAVGLTVPSGARFALIQAETASVRFRDDGTSPTATVGMLLTAGAAPWLYDGNLAGVKFIQVSAGGALNVLFYGE